jgi:hypothetical protein
VFGRGALATELPVTQFPDISPGHTLLKHDQLLLNSSPRWWRHTHLWNVGLLRDYTALHPRRLSVICILAVVRTEMSQPTGSFWLNCYLLRPIEEEQYKEEISSTECSVVLLVTVGREVCNLPSCTVVFVFVSLLPLGDGGLLNSR